MKSLKQILLLLTWYDYRIHRGVAQVARDAGWHLICPKDVVGRKRVLDGWRGDGCIALADGDTLKVAHALNIPLVDLGLTEHNFPVPRLATDNMEIGRIAAEHFIDHGYKEVFTSSPSGIPMFKERLDALQYHMQKQGGAVTVLHSGDRNWAGILNQLETVATRRNTSIEELSVAFFAYEDYRAAELISLCMSKGLRVPENVAVLGVDNDDLINDGLAISLSSVDSDQEGLGRDGARLLVNLLENKDGGFPLGTILRHPPKGIVTRKSTDCYAVRSPLVAKSLHWIQNNYQNAIQAVDVAMAMGVTQQGLQKAFSANHLRSPGEEIRHQRVEAVKHHLNHSPDKLETIAERCGYTSVDTLITSFKRTFGMTPGKFRKLNKRID